MIDDRRAFLGIALATMLFVTSLRVFLGSVYFLNLETLALNWTAGFLILLLSPVLIIVPLVVDHPRSSLTVGASALAMGAIGASAAGTASTAIGIAGIGAAAYLFLLPILLLHSRAVPLAAGIAAALALDAARLAAGYSTEPVTGALKVFILGVLGAILITLMSQAVARREEEAAPVRPGGVFLCGAGFGAWLFVQVTVFGSAYHMARWNEGSVILLTSAVVIGLVAGAGIVTRYAARTLSPSLLVAAQGLPLLLLVDHVRLHSPLLPALLLVAQAVLVIDLVWLLRVISRGTARVAGSAFATAGAVFLGLTFVFAFTLTFAYVPLRALWEERAGPYLLGALLLVIAGSVWAIRRTRPVIQRPFPSGPPDRRLVTVLLVLPLVVGLVAAATPGVTPIAPDGRDVRVVTYNVHAGFSNDGVLDPGLFVRIIQDLDPDIVSLQESDTARILSGNMDLVEVLSKRLGYHAYHGPPTRAQTFGIAILSKYPIEETSLHRLPSGSDNRYLAGVRVDIDGTGVWVFTVHMGLPREDRLAQAAAILAHTEKLAEPHILAGTFNMCPDGACPAHDESDDIYTRFTMPYQDAWTAHGHDRDDPAGHTFHARDLSERTDYIFFTDDLLLRDVQVVDSSDTIAASDHFPIVAEFTVGP